MKTVSSVFIVIVVICFGVVRAAHAGAVYCDVTVIGQDVQALDVPAVQSAINNPFLSGRVTVCLQGTFDFGIGATPANFVSIDPSGAVAELNIAGLNDDSGNKAAIENGFQPLRFAPTSSLPVLTIRNLRFERPGASAISIFRGNEIVEVSDVQIDGVVTQAVLVGSLMTTLREGIAVTSAYSEVSGRIVIKDNKIDGGAYGAGDATINVSGGVVLAGADANPFHITADILIRDNIVRNWSGNGIDSRGPVKVSIVRNLIQPGPFANLVPNPNACVANGIFFVNNNDQAVVVENTIEMVTALTATNTTPCTAGIVLGNNASNGVFRANNVRGTGRYAIAVVAGNPANPSQHNLFLGNNLTAFWATGATVFLGNGALNNTFVGSSGTVVGNIGANTITGLTPIGGGTGEAVSDGVSN